MIEQKEQLASDIKLRRAIDDQERVATLLQYDILDTPPEQDYDHVAEILRSSCNMTWTAITLVDSERQWFKAHQGFDLSETGRAVSFCSVAMHLDRTLVVDDTHRDPRFAHNPLVTGEPHLRFYAGAPIVSSEGFPLGAVCLIDMEPRTLFPSQLQLLSLARDWVQASLELRRLDGLIAQARTTQPDSLRQIEKWRTFAQHRVDHALNLFSMHHTQHNLVPLALPTSSVEPG